MDCKETQERLAQYIDQELSRDELQAVGEHISGCAECRLEYDQQGALDMLLKSCFTPEIPAEHLDGLWPSLADNLEGQPAAGGGSAGNGQGEIHFSSSSAMQILNIPDPKVEEAAVVEAPVAAPAEAPAEEPSPWRWPVALIASTLIVVVGVLVYQNRQATVQGPGPMAAAAGSDQLSPGGAPGAPPTAVAMAPTGEPAAEPLPGSEPEPAADPAPGEAEPAKEGAPEEAAPKDEAASGAPAAVAAKKKARTKRGKARARKGGPKPASEPKPAVAAKPKPKSRARPKPAGKGDDLLDSLIDNALGDEGKAKAAMPKKKKAAAPAPNMDLPEQLSMNQIRASMNRVKGLVQSCYDRFQVEGRANVQMVITPLGKPTQMRIKGKFFGTDTGACVLKAVKKAKFPKFRSKPMTIKYPFILQ